MLNNIRIFENNEFGKLEVIMIDGKPYFPASDCAKILGYKNPRDAIAKHCRGDGVAKCDGVAVTTNQYGVSTNQTVKRTYVSEGNLYRLITRSKLPAAIRFENFVFDEVMPSIRAHGAYIHEDVLEQMRSNSEFTEELIRCLSKEKEKREALLDRLEKIAPKAHYTDIVLRCPNAVQVSIIAKDYAMSAIAFNRMLYKLGVQFRVGKTWLLYQKYHGRGYTITNTYTRNGVVTLVHTCYTQKGRLFLYELLKSHGILPEVEKLAKS